MVISFRGGIVDNSYTMSQLILILWDKIPSAIKSEKRGKNTPNLRLGSDWEIVENKVEQLGNYSQEFCSEIRFSVASTSTFVVHCFDFVVFKPILTFLIFSQAVKCCKH